MRSDGAKLGIAAMGAAQSTPSNLIRTLMRRISCRVGRWRRPANREALTARIHQSQVRYLDVVADTIEAPQGSNDCCHVLLCHDDLDA